MYKTLILSFSNYKVVKNSKSEPKYFSRLCTFKSILVIFNFLKASAGNNLEIPTPSLLFRNFNCIFFWRARLCWPPFCLRRQIMIFEGWWIRTQSAAVTRGQASDLATRPPNSAISNPSLYDLATHPSALQPSHPSLCNLAASHPFGKIIPKFGIIFDFCGLTFGQLATVPVGCRSRCCCCWGVDAPGPRWPFSPHLSPYWRPFLWPASGRT